MKMFLVRHGETNYNRQNCYQGRTNTALNREGLRQAKKLQRRLLSEEIDKIYTSNLMRAMDTARIIADGRGIEVVSSEDLAEIDFGRFEGKTYEEIVKECPGWQLTNFDFTTCGGESLNGLARRVKSFIDEVRGSNPAESGILVVSHSGCLCVLLCLLLEVDVTEWWQFAVAPASLTIVENVHRQSVLALLNDVSHLEI
jgi:broad specificity phosphatase PhoE